MDDVGRLIRHAGPRAEVDAARFDKARARVEAHWESVVAEHRRPRLTASLPNLAIAASVVMMFAAGLVALRLGPFAPTSEVATVARVIGDVRIDDQRIETGDEVPVDGVIATATDSRVALRLPGGRSLRIDEDSLLVANGDSRFALERGAVYFDSGRRESAAPVFIDTPYGMATDVGTQFQVRLLANAIVVGVREGIVAVERPGGEALNVDRGHLLELADDGGADYREIEDDDLWQWTSTIAPEIGAGSMTLASYLAWYARENGYEIAWADAESRNHAMRIDLSVSIQGLTLAEGLAVVQAVAPFDYEIDDATMRVRVER